MVNDQGGIISVKVTTANVDDRKPVLEMVDDLWGVYMEIKPISLVHYNSFIIKKLWNTSVSRIPPPRGKSCDRYL